MKSLKKKRYEQAKFWKYLFYEKGPNPNQDQFYEKYVLNVLGAKLRKTSSILFTKI